MSDIAVPARRLTLASAGWAIAAVFVVGVVVRFVMVGVSPGGFHGDLGYDPGVYYTAADSLLGGQLPYRDFTLLHPPLLMLVLTPFAALGRLTTDHTGFIAGDVAFMLLGAANGALVTAIARRLGLGTAAAVLGGLFYAVWFGTASTEVTVRLEPLGNLVFLLALLALAGRGSSRRAQVLGGVALGLVVCVKIWWIVPVLVVLVALLVWHGRAVALRVLAAAAAAAVVVCAPFFLAAPSAMWHMIITDQLGRGGSTGDRLVRVSRLTALAVLRPGSGRVVEIAVLLVTAAALVVVLLAARRSRAGRVLAAIAASQLLVLALAPTYFTYYSAFAGTGLALVVAAAATGTARKAARLTAVAATAVAAVVMVAAVGSGNAPVSTSVPQTLASKVRHLHCIMTDSPMALIQLNALTRNIDHHCPNWVDVSGRTYSVDAPTGADQRRSDNRRWQADIRRYLLSGDAMIVVRSKTGLSAATKRYLEEHTTPYARAGHWEVRLVRRG